MSEKTLWKFGTAVLFAFVAHVIWHQGACIGFLFGWVSWWWGVPLAGALIGYGCGWWAVEMTSLEGRNLPPAPPKPQPRPSNDSDAAARDAAALFEPMRKGFEGPWPPKQKRRP
jgi:hypothetical protein